MLEIKSRHLTWVGPKSWDSLNWASLNRDLGVLKSSIMPRSVTISSS